FTKRGCKINGSKGSPLPGLTASFSEAGMFAGARLEDARSTAAAADTDDHPFNRNLFFDDFLATDSLIVERSNMCAVTQLRRTEKAATFPFPYATIAFRHEFIFPVRDALSTETM